MAALKAVMIGESSRSRGRFLGLTPSRVLGVPLPSSVPIVRSGVAFRQQACQQILLPHSALSSGQFLLWIFFLG